VDTDWKPRRNSSPLDSWSPAAPDAAQDLTTAKTVAKISVASNTAGGKKSVARRSTGLDYSSIGLNSPAYALRIVTNPFLSIGRVYWTCAVARLSGKWPAGRVQLLPHKWVQLTSCDVDWIASEGGSGDRVQAGCPAPPAA
jgi:hypothetical protein